MKRARLRATTLSTEKCFCVFFLALRTLRVWCFCAVLWDLLYTKCSTKRTPTAPPPLLLTRAERLCTGRSPVISQVWTHWIFTGTIWNVSILQKRKLRHRAVRPSAQSCASPAFCPLNGLVPSRQQSRSPQGWGTGASSGGALGPAQQQCCDGPQPVFFTPLLCTSLWTALGCVASEPSSLSSSEGLSSVTDHLAYV